MKNTIRCCIACILPCGALDVIRIVHTNGHVEEISGSIMASEVMRAHPRHVLKKPSSPSSYTDEHGNVSMPRIVIVPPDAELQRGTIYFLMPLPPADRKGAKPGGGRKKKRESGRSHTWSGSSNSFRDGADTAGAASLVVYDRYLTEILSEKCSTPRDGRRGRVGVWRPHLESISETPNLIELQ